MTRFCFNILLILSLLPGRSSYATNDSVPPSYVWQSPCAVTAASAVLLFGAMPLVVPEFHNYNLFIRDEMQQFRRDYFNDKGYHFDNWTQYLPTVALPTLKLLGVPAPHTYMQQFCRIAGSFILIGSVVLPLKECGLEWRPDHGSDNSFPSGHTATSFIGAEMLRLEYSQVSPLITVVGYGIATFTGIMRVYNNRHWLGDVLAGSVIGIIAADLSYYLCQRYIDPLCQRLFCPKAQGSVSLVTTPDLQLP